MGHQAIKLITDATVEPITLAQAKAYLRIDTSDTADDTLVSSLITAARRHAETYAKLSLITQTWDLWLDHFPFMEKKGDVWWSGTRQIAVSEVFGGQAAIHVPKGPLLAVTWLKTYGLDDSVSTFDPTLLVTDTASVPGRVFLTYGNVWPTDLRTRNAINLRYTAGFGTDSTLVPTDLVQAVKILIAHFYENREPILEGRALETPLSVRSLLDPYRVTRL